jgi:HAD superfamily hydrolase (TIGR01450 family)
MNISRNFVNVKNIKPAICFDVDGVLRRGPSAIPGARETIMKLRNLNIPISIITNGGGEPEHRRADVINKVIGLSEDHGFKKHEIQLCHSPMKSVLDSYNNNKTVLITGTGDLKAVMKEYNYHNYITVDEYSKIFPFMFPHFFVETE